MCMYVCVRAGIVTGFSPRGGGDIATWQVCVCDV